MSGVSGGSTVKYFDSITDRTNQITFSDSVYPNPIAAIFPDIEFRTTANATISKYWYSNTEHYWIAKATTSLSYTGLTIRVFYI